MRVFTIFFICHLFCFIKSYGTIDEAKKAEIKIVANKCIAECKIPGLGLVLADGSEKAEIACFGYADLKTKRPVSKQTYFELGSTSKAFTALGILVLEARGKLELSDSITKFIPWLKMTYKGREACLNIKHFLDHTSGVPFNTIEDIPVSNSDNALENTVKMLTDYNLDYPPGIRFQYASINYDVLGLVIQNITGEGFEDFMYKEILDPLGLKNTCLLREHVPSGMLAKGYKLGFGRLLGYEAPFYRGNTPAGYFICNVSDLGKWLQILLKQNNVFMLGSERDVQLRKSKIYDLSDGQRYRYGWFFNKERNCFFHIGQNPNYSSFLIFDPCKKVGLALQANIKTDALADLGMNIYDIVNNQKIISSNFTDLNRKIDKVFSYIIILCIPFLLIGVVKVLKMLKREKLFKKTLNPKSKLLIIALTLFMLLYAYLIYHIPRFTGFDFSWNFIMVWAPISVVAAAVILLFSGMVTYFISVLRIIYK